MLQSTGFRRVGCDLATEQKIKETHLRALVCPGPSGIREGVTPE